MRFVITVGCVAALFLGLSAPAQAAIRYAVFRGSIDSGYDYTGAFGAVGDLTGKRYVATYGFDTTRGVDRVNSYSEELIDGFSLGRFEPNPIISFTISLGGHVVDAYDPPQRYGVVATYDAYDTLGFAGVVGRFSSGDGDFANNFGNTLYSLTAANRLSADVTVRDGKYYPGGPMGNAEQRNGANSFAYRFDMRPGWVSITGDPRSATPEPGAWALMISGFAVAGGMLRRRTKGPARAA